ncbi:hypothetical protein FCI23_41825 [Actinacidiphila oryziradicis]|uniref:Uncharacterized protein n=1 Tax=Actinacidiphila oryziradicis TaxID=2571141 RepID=A0A4U0RWZ5_9ACTN|nr:hypothetical protein FCI23_41825 [Actinacidiphila oryziradicis]
MRAVGDSPEQVAAAQRQMVRIGIDRPAGAATGDLDALTAPDQKRAPTRVSPSPRSATPGRCGNARSAATADPNGSEVSLEEFREQYLHEHMG